MEATTPQATNMPQQGQPGPASATRQEQDKTGSRKKAIIIGVVVAAALAGGYFWLWPLMKKRRDSNGGPGTSTSVPATTEYTPAPPRPASYTAPAPKRPTDTFPLKRGSRGANVKALQNALIAQFGASILPKYGADGDFGSETETALVSKGLPKVIDETQFNVLVANTSPDPEKLGKDLYAAVMSKDFTKTIGLLAKITTPSQYSEVSEVFQRYPLGLVRYTLVNALLNIFDSESQKQQLRNAFTRMGLKYNGKQWSLSGLNGFNLVTMQPTIVWVNSTTAIKVPERMVLGQEIERRGKYAAFENGGKKFLVEAAHVRYA